MSRSRLTGRAFTERMNEAKARKARETQRFPERAAKRNEGPQLQGPKLDGRWMKETPRADPMTDLIMRNMRKLELVTEPAPEPTPEKKQPATGPTAAGAHPQSAPPKPAAASVRQFPRERKPAPAPVAPPKKGVLASVVPPKAS